jgi:hypothetical protein
MIQVRIEIKKNGEVDTKRDTLKSRKVITVKHKGNLVFSDDRSKSENRKQGCRTEESERKYPQSSREKVGERVREKSKLLILDDDHSISPLGIDYRKVIALKTLIPRSEARKFDSIEMFEQNDTHTDMHDTK